MEIKRVLVTGSSGTIGTKLCEELMAKGYDVVGVDWVENKWNKEVDAITIQQDLRNKQEVFEKLPRDVDLIIHLAANARVYNLVVDTSQAEDNITTVYNMLDFAKEAGVKKFMFASSRETYGNEQEKLVYSEKDASIDGCESPYTASKIAGEALVQAYRRCYGIDAVIFRFSNVYGKYDDSDRVIPLFIKLCKEGKDLTIFGEDKELDFTYIDDTIDGIVLCIEKFDDIKNEVYNLASGEGTKLVDLAHIIKDAMECKTEIHLEPNRTGEVVKYVADITKAERELGYEPKVGLDEGIKLSIEWYTKNITL